MEFDEIVVKESPGLCRCCLSEGCYKDMGTEYSWMNENEVYADMLLECFDISISQHNDGPNGPNRLICEVCITRLRDACYFKKQVLDSEKKFVDMVGRGEFKSKVVMYQSQMKSESAEEVIPEPSEVEYLDDNADFVDDDMPKAEDSEPTGSEVTADPLPVRSKRGRPRKNTAVKPEKKKVKVEQKTKNKTIVKGTRRVAKADGKKAESSKKARKTAMTAKEKLDVMRRNVYEVLVRSTLMPFRWLKSSYRCFYCYELFEEPKDLKAHQVDHNTDDEKRKAMSNYWEPTVYVDVSDLSCKLCPFAITDLYKFIEHLVGIHNMPFNENIDLFMSPFKLNQISVQCIECDQKCRTFGHLIQHTNREHKGVSQVLCDICGRHFKNTTYLKDHISRVHRKKAVKCTLCGEEVPSSTRMRTHLQKVHNKRYKCFVCTEMFDTHYRRSHHMMTVHKHRDEVKCQHCPKTFVFRSTMMRHLRETHLQERNVVCAICGWRAFGPHRLQRHMMKHSNDRNFKCTSCDKAFKTHKTMKQHYINIHEKSVAVQNMMPAVPYDATIENPLLREMY